MDEKMELDTMVYQHAKKTGITPKEAKKALKKMKSGGMMSQIAPQLQQNLLDLNPNLSPRDKLRAKLNTSRMGRTNKTTKSAMYEKQRTEAYQRREDEEQKKKESADNIVMRAEQHQRDMDLLESKLGSIDQSLYVVCLNRQNGNEYVDDIQRQRDRNIIDLYCRQQKFTDMVSMDDL